MGKIRLKVVGDETQEREQKEEQKRKAEQKQARKAQVKGVGLGGGERINTVGVTEEEIAKELETKPEVAAQAEEAKTESKKTRGNKQRAKEARIRSKRHVANSGLVSNKTSHPIKSGIELLRKFKKSNFDETVELHINVKEKGVSGVIALPHGTGKKLRIKVVDDALIAQVEAGKIDFDVLVATPDMMPRLAKVARILGPKGLMPNPKNGTISDKPESVVEKLSAGQVNYKTEAVVPLIHLSVGKLSFGDDQLEQNIQTALNAIGPARIDKVILKSSMSPAVQIQI